MSLMRIVVAWVLVALAALPASAQQGTRLRGTVDAVDGNVLSMTTRGGEKLRVTLADAYSVMWVAPIEATDIKPGMFVGVGASPQPDGTFRAVQVVAFPESMRGTGEGHRAWNTVPDGTMTNATVEASVDSTDGRSLALRLPDRTVRLTIGPEARMVIFFEASRADLKAGANVVFTATPGVDGAPRASRILVGKDGFVPTI